MPFIERTQFNLPLIFNPEIGRASVEYSEYSHAVESSQAIFDDSDAVVIDLSRLEEESFVPATTNLSNQETAFLLRNISEETVGSFYGLNSFVAPLASYKVASRLHRFPVYGSLIIDVYI